MNYAAMFTPTMFSRRRGSETKCYIMFSRMANLAG